MTEALKSIALVTPLKDEIDNIDRFLDKIEKQTIPIKCLVIVENDSSDGSKEYLEKISSIKNVEFFEKVHMTFDDASYRVGKKYATIIKKGMDFLKKKEFYNSLDYIGILDSDVFPEEDYYRKLTDFLHDNPKMGITSGIMFTENGKLHAASRNWVRGGCRIWKKECLDEAGYFVVHTADTISLALAHLNGWQTGTVKSAKVISREVNARLGNSKSKGYHAYYRGHTFLYAVSKFAYFSFVKGKVKRGYDYLMGYIEGALSRKPRISDPRVRKYFRFYLINKIKKQIKAV